MKRMRLRGRLFWLALAMVAAVVAVAGCYNNNTGRTEVGPGVNFKLPAFPETGSNYRAGLHGDALPAVLPCPGGAAHPAP